MKNPKYLPFSLLFVSLCLNYYLLSLSAPNSIPEIIEENHSDSIFIGIASYRDSDLQNTIDDAFEQAKFPYRVYIGVCVQEHKAEIDLIREKYEYHPNIKFMYIAPELSEGVGWARKMTFNFYDDQTFALVIDSHTRFLPDWDVTVVNEFKKALKYSDNPILTCDPATYTGYINPQKDQFGVPMRIENELPMLESVAVRKTYYDPQPTTFVSGRFLFTWGRWMRDVLTDIVIHKQGEDFMYSLHSFSVGFDLFYPTKNIVWHHKFVSDRKPLSWLDNPTKPVRVAEKSKGWIQEQIGYDNMTFLFEFDKSIFAYTALRSRTDWDTLIHMHIEHKHYYLEDKATEFLPQKHVKLLRTYQPKMADGTSLPKGKVILQVATLSGGRYIIARLIECGYTLYAIPVEDVEAVPNHERSYVNFNCL